MRYYRTAVLMFVAFAASLFAAQAQSRINGTIDEAHLVTLSGNVSSLAQPEFDLGAVPQGTLMTHMRLVLSRTAAQEQALEAFMAAQQNPQSPYYHQWLTPAQFSQHYGVVGDDLNTLLNWLTGRGFSIERVDSGGMSIAFSGRVVDVENAFHTQIHQFNLNGESFLANVSDPQIPAALAPVVVGVSHLNTIKPTPYFTHGPAGQFDPAKHALLPLADQSHPNLASCSGGSCQLYVTPQDAATIYDTPNKALNINYSGSTTVDGAGMNIGIGGDSLILATTVWNYRSLFLGQTIPTPTPPTTEPCGTNPAISHCIGSVQVSKDGQFTIYNIDNATQNGDADEAYIDTELSGGIAPGAQINFYVSTDLISGIEQMLSDNRDNVFSLSFGECESALGAASNIQLKSWWQQAAAQGVSVFVSAGDSGAAGCDYQPSTGYSSGGLAVSGFASTPYNVAVGGTDYYPLVNNFSQYVSSTNSALFGGALSYIPESTWNDTTYPNDQIAQNALPSGYGAGSFAAGSGGKSSCASGTGATCKGYAKPGWQSALTPADAVRDLPDVSLLGANGTDNASWLVCTDDTVSGTSFTTNCASINTQGQFYFNAFGGTSTSSPAFAGIFALVAQAQGGSVGLPNPELYLLAAGSHNSSIFHDITVGDIAVPCDATSSPSGSCAAVTSGTDYTTGYNTATGYDLATGIGSVDVTQLVNYWGTATGSGTANIVVSFGGGATSANTGQTLSVTATVTGSGGTPTGKVTFSSGSYTSAAQVLSGGTVTFDIPAYTLAGGTSTPATDTITASYSGDAIYAPTSGSNTVSVTSTTYTMTVATTSVTHGSAATPTVSLIGYGGYTGTVTIVCSVSASPAGAVNPPTCSGGTATPGTTGAPGTVNLNIMTTAAALAHTGTLSAEKTDWTGAAGGLALALLLFFGVPARSRKWRSMLGALLLFVAIGYLSGCNSGGSSSSGGGGSTGTTAGNYTITVSGTGSDVQATKVSTTFTLTVN